MTIFDNLVTKGAALLDKKEPGWFEKIDWKAFDIRSTRYCVIAQLADKDGVGYYDKLEELGLMSSIGAGEVRCDCGCDWMSTYYSDTSNEYGFSIKEEESDGYDWNDLQLAWELYIADRKTLASQ